MCYQIHACRNTNICTSIRPYTFSKQLIVAIKFNIPFMKADYSYNQPHGMGKEITGNIKTY